MLTSGNISLYWTQLFQHKVICFLKNGEEFILLPHLFQTALSDFTSHEIEISCEEVNIQLLRCNSKEISILKSKKILPEEYDSIGLIRRSDAERLIKILNLQSSKNNLLENENADKLSEIARNSMGELSNNMDSFLAVRHDCFGSQPGKFYPSLYVHCDSVCIVCDNCQQSFSPAQFAGHTHNPAEIKTTVHWGFDSRNWRQYIFLDDEVAYSEDDNRRALEQLDKLKEKFFDEETNEQSPKMSYRKMRTWKAQPTSITLPPVPSVILKSFNNKVPDHIFQFNGPIEVEREKTDDVTMEDSDYPPNVILKAHHIKAPTSYLFNDDANNLSPKIHLENNFLQTLESRPLIERSAAEVNSHTRAYNDAQLSLVKMIFSLDNHSTSSTSKLSSQLLTLFERVKKIHQEEINDLKKKNHILLMEMQRNFSVSKENKALPSVSTPYYLKMKAKYEAMKDEYHGAKEELNVLKRRLPRDQSPCHPDSPCKKMHVSSGLENEKINSKLV